MDQDSASLTPPGLRVSGARSGYFGGAGWTIFVLALCHAQAIASFQVLNILVDPIKASLQISDTQYSLLQGLAVAVFAAVLGIPAARWGDLRGYRNIILAGALGWSLMTVSCAFVSTFGEFFVARVLMGIGEVFLFPAAMSLISSRVPPHRLGAALALFGCGGPAGGAAALFGGGWIVANDGVIGEAIPLLASLEGWRLAFLFCGISGILTAALLLSVREPQHVTKQEGGFGDVLSFVWRFRREYLPVSAGMLCLAISAFAAAAWTPTVLIRWAELSPVRVGQLTGAAGILLGPLCAWLAGWASDRLHGRGEHRGVIQVSIGAASLLALLAAIAAVSDIRAVSVAGWLGLYGLLAAPTVLAGMALQILTPARMRAQVIAIHLLLVNLVALSAGPFAVAFITDSIIKNPLAVNLSLGAVIIGSSLLSAGFLLAGLKRFRTLPD